MNPTAKLKFGKTVAHITCKRWQDFWNIMAPNRCNILRRIQQTVTIRELKFLPTQWRFLGEIGACRVTGISYPERFVKWNFPHSCWILKPVCGFSRQDVRQIFFSVRISFPNITMSWPITLQTCIQRHNIISVDPDSFSSGVIISAIFFTAAVVEVATLYSLFLAVSTLYYATEKSKRSMESRQRILWHLGWRRGWIDRSMLVFREAKTMPVQQIVVNPVTLQQTNNKDRKVSSPYIQFKVWIWVQKTRPANMFSGQNLPRLLVFRVWRLFIL